MEVENIWIQVKASLKKKNPSNHFLHTWIEPVQVLAQEKKEGLRLCFEFLVPSELHKHWISENLVDLISSEISNFYPKEFEVRLKVEPKLKKQKTSLPMISNLNPFPPRQSQNSIKLESSHVKKSAAAGFQSSQKKLISYSSSSSSLFHPQYTFSTFVVGRNNEFAHAAAFHVAENPHPRPTENYNPLFIYGPTGMGKTHLLHAMGNHMQNKHPRLRLKYLSAETFLNDFISGIRRGEMDKFRRKYRDRCDVLLMDDIQVLKQGEASQEEFFYTLNHFFSHSRQVAFASDRMPKDMEGLQDRVRTRLEWGLIADVKMPDVETRMAILKYKAETMSLNLPHEVALYLARLSKRSIRELEGNLNKIKMFSELQGDRVDLDLARKLFASHITFTPLTPQAIQKMTAKHYKIPLSDMKSKSRSPPLVVARQVGMYLIKKHLHRPLTEIGQLFGKKDHTTVLSAVKRVEVRKKKDSLFGKDLEHLETEIHISMES